MSKAVYTGVGGIARKVPKLYVGVGGVARKVKKGYVGVGGVARLFYDGDADNPTLPSAYQLLKYIDFSSESYGAIDCGLSAEHIDVINVKAQMLSSSGGYVVGWQYKVSNNISVIDITVHPSNNYVQFKRGYYVSTSTSTMSSHKIVVPDASKLLDIIWDRRSNTVSVDDITES